MRCDFGESRKDVIQLADPLASELCVEFFEGGFFGF